VCIHAEIIEIIYAQKIIETIPRLRGEEKQAINYRHIIDSLVRKPGAFANYRYREDLFPTTRFRIAYDILKKQKLSRADKAYLSILYLAAYEGEAKVDCALKSLIDEESPITKETVGRLISENKQAMPKDVFIADIDLSIYDWFFTEAVV
jgi:hypothetical protein